jgi:predicted enzyme related to lactoylglutathione lyase
MTQQRTYPHGVTSWIDCVVPDVDAASRFYSALFGWTFGESEPDASLVASLDGQSVAGLGRAEGDPAAWVTYVAVDDAEATAAAVPALGGTVVVAPRDAGDAGRWAACVDPQGAPFRLWQARGRPGAQLTNAPGTWNFSDLHTPDRAAAMAFYRPLFGWVDADMEMDAGTMIQVPGYGDHLAATVDPGIHERQAAAPAGFADVIGGLVVTDPAAPARWQVTFSVADREVRDPQGAEFTVSQFTPPEGDW